MNKQTDKQANRQKMQKLHLSTFKGGEGVFKW